MAIAACYVHNNVNNKHFSDVKFQVWNFHKLREIFENFQGMLLKVSLKD